MATTSSDAQQEVGLFQVNYLVGTGEPGALELTLRLQVSTPNKHVEGSARLFEPVQPVLDNHYSVSGAYYFISWMGGSRIRVDLTGRRKELEAEQPGIEPLSPLSIELSLLTDWSSGVAQYRYLDAHGQSKVVTDVPVKRIPPEAN